MSKTRSAIRYIDQEVTYACADLGEGRRAERGGDPADAGGNGGVPEVQRGARQGGRRRRVRPSLSELAGQAGAVRRQEAESHRRALRGEQGACGRILAVAGALAGRGLGMAEAGALRRRDG